MRCRFVASDHPRVLVGRHLSDCDDAECDSCEPCSQSHCRLCGRAHLDVANPQTCPECVGAVRDDLVEVRDLCAHLRERALNGSNAHGRRFASMRLPGGDPLVLHGPVGDGSADVRLRWAPVYDPEHPDADADGYRDASDDDNGHLESLELPGDPESPALTLGGWEDIWREMLGHDAGGRFDYWTSATYLLSNLTWAGQRLDPFDEFARDVRRLRRHLEDKLADGDRAEVTEVPCLTCGARLVKVYERQAKDDHHKCPRCRRVHKDGEFERAKRQHMTSDDADTWVLLADAAKSIGRSQHTIRTWARPRHRATVKVSTDYGQLDTGLIKGEHIEPVPRDHPPKCLGCVWHPDLCIGCLPPKVQTDRELIEGEGGTMVRVYVWWPDVRQADMESGRRTRTA